MLYAPTQLNGVTSGLLLTYYNNNWGTVCDDFSASALKNIAIVACRALGYAGGTEYDADGARSGYPIVADNSVNTGSGSCTGNEALLNECPGLRFGAHNCAHEEDIGVRCVDTNPPPSPPPSPPPTPPPPTPPPLSPLAPPRCTPGFVVSMGGSWGLSCDGSAGSGDSFWFHTLWSTCGTTLCTAEIDASTGCARDTAYMRHGGDGCGCGSGILCECGDGSVAGGGVGAPLHAHYVRGCAWACDDGFERDATGNACIVPSPPSPSPPPPPRT